MATTPAVPAVDPPAATAPLLLFAAALLAFAGGIIVLGWAILAVVVLNAGLAFAQEQQAERAIEALAAYLPPHTTVIRDGLPQLDELAIIAPFPLIVWGADELRRARRRRRAP